MVRDPNQARLLKAYRSNESQLRAYLRRYVDTSSDVDDVCQETITRSLEAARERPVENPGAFLYGIARNIVRKHFERKSRSLIDVVADYVPDKHPSGAADLDDIMIRSERLSRYQDAIDRLPPKTKRVFTLRKIYGYSHREIADMLGISVKTVENHVTEGLKRCRRQLADTLSMESGDNVVSLSRQGQTE